MLEKVKHLFIVNPIAGDRDATDEVRAKAEKAFEKIMAKDSSNLMRGNTNLQIREAEQTPSKINPKKCMPRHIIIKLLKLKTKKKS